jgi:pyruvate dehydrogenase E2 component (dihydrolipoamide acetyltransferase)/2-oxoisovalerate dehydrogenase E2 component (dihydrolipoyl transacylase)
MDFALPEIGEGVYEAELVRWLVRPGDTVKRGQTLMEVMTDKASMEVPSPFAGTINDLRAEPGAKVKVGDVLLTYQGQGEPETALAPQAAAIEGNSRARTVTVQAAETGRNGPGVPVKAAPSVRYLARKLGVDINRVHGSGPQGRVLVEDLTSQLPQLRPTPSPTPGADAPGLPPSYGTRGTRQKLQGLRRTIAERMVQSRRAIPDYTYVDECDVTELVRLREGLREGAARLGIKMTYLAFAAKAVVGALQEVPLVNATLDEGAGEIVLHDCYHLGIAVAAPAGLLVPVVRDANKKDLFQLAREIEQQTAAARSGRAKREDLTGSTFTLTSIGNIGGLFSTPIINPPEVGILGIGKIVRRPVYDAAGQIKPADLVYLSFSFDHRVVDGAVGAAFGNAVVRRLQQPAALLLPS